MGSVAGPNIIVMMLTAMEHDIQSQINTKMDSQMLMSMQSIFLGNAKAAVYQQYGNIDTTTEEGKNAWNKMQKRLEEITVRERQLQNYEKTLDMKLKQLENQLKMIQQRKEAAQKMLDKNIQDAFSYGHGR